MNNQVKVPKPTMLVAIQHAIAWRRIDAKNWLCRFSYGEELDHHYAPSEFESVDSDLPVVLAELGLRGASAASIADLLRANLRFWQDDKMALCETRPNVAYPMALEHIHGIRYREAAFASGKIHLQCDNVFTVGKTSEGRFYLVKINASIIDVPFEWLEERHPGCIDRIRLAVDLGVTGVDLFQAMYEPVEVGALPGNLPSGLLEL